MIDQNYVRPLLLSAQRPAVGLSRMLRIMITWIIAIAFCASVGLLEAQEVPFTSVVASDNFNRPNGPLGTNWAEPLATQGNLVVTNDVVGVDTENAHCEAYWSANSFSDNQYSQASLTTTGPWTGVILRADTNQDMFYLGFVFGPNDYRIYSRYNGAYYSLATGSAVTWQVGDTLRLEVSGSVNPVTITMYQNGTPVLMWRSTLPVEVFTGGSPGLGIYSRTGAGLTISNWEGGNLDPDTNAPTVPANLAASAAGPAEINLSWNSATDDVGVAGYLVERSEGAGSTNFTLIATPTGTNYSDTELTGATTYNYVVMATDAAGNLSGGTGVTATTPIPAPPTISVISNQTTLAGISAGPFPIYISDPGIDPSTLTITATSSNPTLVPDQNVFIYNDDLIQSLTIIPVAGQSGTSTITITVSNSVNSTNTSFLLTVNPPGGATDVFANTSNIVIPSLGTATPYPSTINVSGALGTITNLTVTLENMSHSNPGDVNVLLVGPGGQAVVLMSDTVGDNPMTNLTFTLSDQAYYPLPQPSPMLDGTFQPTDDAPNNTNSPYAFPLPAPAFPYSPNLGTFDGLSPNGTWSLYVYDGGTDDGGQISGGWSLAITTVLPTITTKSIQMTNSKSALITGIGAAGAVYTIQASTNLINWQRIGTATTGTNGVFSFKDSNTASFKSRFYRIMLP